MMTVTYAAPADVRLNDSTKEPRLHAFPEGSTVALCGRLRSAAETRAATKRCRTCVEAASRKGFVGR